MPLLLSITLACWFGSEVLIFRRDAAPVDGASADRGSRALIILAIAGGIFLAISVTRAAPWATMPWPRAISFWAGVALMWTGMIVRLWAVRTLGRFFRTTVTMLADHRLVREGPYAVVRHPAYAGALTTCLGFGFALSNWLALAIMLAGPGLAFARRIVVEEHALAATLGDDWRAYRHESWALIPMLW